MCTHMIQVTVREFRNNLAKYLRMPCQVLSHGVPIASIVPTGKLDIPPMPKKIEKEVRKVEKAMDNAVGDWKEPTQEPKYIWVNGHKWEVDEFGNEKLIK